MPQILAPEFLQPGVDHQWSWEEGTVVHRTQLTRIAIRKPSTSPSARKRAGLSAMKGPTTNSPKAGNIHPGVRLVVVVNAFRYRGSRLRRSAASELERAEDLLELDRKVVWAADRDPTEFQHGYVDLLVHDWGQGIPPESQLHIFERLFRLERDMNSAKRGSGIGLSACQELVEAMGGVEMKMYF
jgi:hypothetical protein